MHTKQLLTVAVAAVVALSVIGPAAAADGLNVSVTQDGDDVAVTVTANNTSVAGADVTVDDGNVTYDEAGNYTTDDEGLVELSAPEENVTVTVTAYADNDSASATADLVAESIAENETEKDETDLDENETEKDETDLDENETEEESETDRPFDIDLNLTIDNGTADYSNVTVDDSEPFGLYVSSFVHTIMGENVSGPMGQTVSAFVTTFNPGQGPPEHAGPSGNTTQGPPEHVGPSGNTTQGPPEDAGPSDDEDDEAEDDDRRRGPPEHAKGGR